MAETAALVKKAVDEESERRPPTFPALTPALVPKSTPLDGDGVLVDVAAVAVPVSQG